MQTNLPMYACTTWFSTTDMFQDVHMPFIYTLQERLILLWQIKNKNKQIYCIYLCSLHMDMVWFIYIYIDIDISFTSIYKPRFNDIKNMCHTSQCHRSAPFLLRSTFFAFSPLASNWFHAASMSSRFGAAYAFGSHGNIDSSTTSFGIWDGRWIWEKVCLSLELGLILWNEDHNISLCWGKI